MKLDRPVNENYAATVVRINNTIKLPGLDNLVGVPIFGYQALTGKDVILKGLYLFFPAEVQLSNGFAAENNLHRHSDLNIDPTQKGYLEDNRRVKAIKLRGNRSDGLLMPLSSLKYLDINYNDLKEGDTFDHIGGEKVCEKYYIPVKHSGATVTRRTSRVDEIFIPRHFDTANYFRNHHLIPDLSQVVVTQKLHGTSIRVGNTWVKRKLKWYEKLAKKFGVKVQETEFAYVFGSRKVIKDPNNSDQNDFYGFDLHSEVGKSFEGLIPRGFVLYGEIIGWIDDNKPIQPNYTYHIPRGQRAVYFYRVTHIGPTGIQTDLSWDHVKEFCYNLGLNYAPEIVRQNKIFFQPEDYLDRKLYPHYDNALPLSDPNTVDEGVCIRKEGMVPLILKAKSPIFLQHETILLDKGVADIENEG